MSQIKMKYIKKLLDTIYVPQNNNSPYLHARYVLPLFVMNCQRAIKAHHQKEVVEEIIKHSPNQHVKPKTLQAHPPKSIHAPPERS